MPKKKTEDVEVFDEDSAAEEIRKIRDQGADQDVMYAPKEWEVLRKSRKQREEQ